MAGSFVRKRMVEATLPPVRHRGLWRWLRTNLFASWRDCLVSLIGCALFAAIIWYMINWLVLDAVWSGSDRAACATLAQGGVQPDGWNGACWAFVKANFSQFLYGRYPQAEQWRVDVMALITLVIVTPLLIPAIGHKFLNALAAVFIVPLAGYVLFYGGVFGLAPVDTQLWGGLMVTLAIAYVSVAISLPLGIALALGRRSRMRVVKTACVVFIETIRGIPLVTILFMASVMFPLFLPSGMTVDKFLRALFGIALFTSAYMAEVFRGGLQAVPRGQYEGAEALGLRYWPMMLLIVIPQGVRLVIPGVINVILGMFKETSLIYIISMFDLLGIARQLSQQANWITPQTPATSMVFVGLVFWFCCFAMSRYAQFIERRLNISRHN